MQGSKDGLSENRKKSIKVRIKKNKLFTIESLMDDILENQK